MALARWNSTHLPAINHSQCVLATLQIEGTGEYDDTNPRL